MDDDLKARLGRLVERARETEQDRSQLPCSPGEVDDETGAAACEAVTAHSWCPYARDPALCARARLIDSRQDVRTRLIGGDVPEREREILLAAVDRRAPLRVTDALAAVRARIAGKPWGLGSMRGNETIIALAGPRGIGKTLAACYAIGRLGGRYVLAYRLARIGLEIDDLVTPPVVVVDQLGRESPSSDWFSAQFEELVDRRYANRRLTILVGNLTYEQFAQAYDRIIEDRMRGDGAFLALTGSSLRGPQPAPRDHAPPGG